jgi:hypothetical protein
MLCHGWSIRLIIAAGILSGIEALPLIGNYYTIELIGGSIRAIVQSEIG